MHSLSPILLVEDNPSDIELALIALERCQLENEIVIARDGAEAIDYLYSTGKFTGRAGGSPAVVLLDLKMPRVSGLDVLERIKSDPDVSAVPIVMFTSSDQEFDRARAYAFGVNAFVVKPLDFTQFLETIQNLGIFWGTMNRSAPSAMDGECSLYRQGAMRPDSAKLGQTKYQ